MKRTALLACAAAVLALAACNKSKNQPQGTTASNETVTITQANPPPGGTWADVVNATSSGFMMGNPKAKVKLVEIGSLSCPHCKKFDDEGVPALIDKYVKTGAVSWEFRPYVIHGQVDMAANLVVSCNGLKSFFPLARAMYKDQDSWMARIQSAPQEKLTELQNLPPDKAFVATASLLGFQDWAAARGVPQAKTNQCLTDQKMIDHQVQVTSDVAEQFPDFQGTPSFVINGTLLKDTASWDKLEPQLKAAL